MLRTVLRRLRRPLFALAALTASIPPLHAQTEITALDASRHLFADIQMTGRLATAGRQVRIWRSRQADRATAELVAPAFSLVAPDTQYFRWTDPTALANRDYHYWAEALGSGGAVLEQVGPIVGRRPLDVVDVSTWEQTTPPPATDFGNHDLRLLSHGGYLYLYGAGSTLRRSADGGVTWQTFTTGTVTFVQLVGGDGGVLHGMNRINSSGGSVWRSDDNGATWTPIPTTNVLSAGQAGLPVQVERLAFGGGRWLATRSGYVFSSTNGGANWVNLGQKLTVSFGDIFYAQSRFVGWASSGGGSMAYHSTDGATWSPATVFDANRSVTVRWMVYTGAEYIAAPQVTPQGAPQRFYRGANLTAWTVTEVTPEQARLFSATAPQLIGGRYYGTLGGRQLVRTASTTNLSDWTVVDDNLYADVVHTGSRFLAAGRGGFLAQSANGQTWSSLTGTPTNQNILQVLHGPGGWVALPESGAPLHSADGRLWQRAATPPATRHLTWRSAAVGAGRHVLYGSYTYVPIYYPTTANGTTTFTFPLWQNVTETFLVSTDGVTWTEQSNVQNAQGAATTIKGGLHFIDGGFSAQSNADPTKLMRSTDGLAWSQSPSGFSPPSSSAELLGLFRHGAEVFAFGHSGNYFGTPNGFVNGAAQLDGAWTTRIQGIRTIRHGVHPWDDRLWSLVPYNSGGGVAFTIAGSADGQTWENSPFSAAVFPTAAAPSFVSTHGLGAFLAPATAGESTLVTSAGADSAWYPVSPGLGLPLKAAAASADTLVAAGPSGRFYLATLPVVSPPSITAQPASASAYLGESVTLAIETAGDPVLAYQWYAGTPGNTSAPLASTSPSITLSGLAANTSVWVRVGNEYGEADSAAIPVTVLLPIPVLTPPASIPTFIAGAPVSLALSATFSPVFAAEGLPAGLSIDPATGRISGSTTQVGDFAVSLTLTNGVHVGEGAFTLRILPAPPVLLGPALVPGKWGASFHFALNATGSPTAFAATGLPPGLSIDPATGVLSGTPTAPGRHVVQLSATNAGGTTERTITIDVADTRPRPEISSPLQAVARQGTAFQYLLTATGSPTGFALGALPAGLSFDAMSGAISGTPLVSGRFEIEVRADHDDLQGAPAVIQLHIEPDPDLPRMLVPAFGSARVGEAFSAALAASHAATQFHWEAVAPSALPPGLALSAAGVLSGTPTQAGVFALRVWAVNASGAGPKTDLQIAVATPLDAAQVLVAEAIFHGRVGEIFSAALESTAPGATFSAADLPPGLTLDPATGQLSGTPAEAGRFVARFTASAAGVSGPERLHSIVVAPVEDAPEIAGPLAWSARAGEPLVITLATTGEPDAFAVAGLPEGLALLAETGQIHGLTGATGAHRVEITPSRDGVAGELFELQLLVEAGAGAPGLLGPSRLAAVVGQPFDWTPSVQLAPGDSLAFVTGENLPAGLSLDTATGAITGTPLRTGVFVVTLRPTGAVGGSGAPLVVRIDVRSDAEAPRILNSPVIELQLGDTVSLFLDIGAETATAYGADELPPGLALDRFAGRIHGLAREAGVFETRVFAANTAGTGPGQTLRFVVSTSPSAPRVVTSFFHGAAGESVSFQLTATGLPAHGAATPLPDGFGYVAENLPDGLALDPTTGLISGVLPEPGSYAIRTTAVNAAGPGPWMTGEIRVTSATGPRILGPARLVLPQAEPTEVTLQAAGLTASHSIGWSPSLGIAMTGTGQLTRTLVGDQAGAGSLYAHITEPRVFFSSYRSGGIFSRRTYTYSYTAWVTVFGKTIPIWVAPSSDVLPDITASALQIAQVGAPFSLALSATRDPIGYQLAAGTALPSGLTFDGHSVNGTPRVPGRYTIFAQARNAAGLGLVKSIELVVAPAAEAPAFTGFTLSPLARGVRAASAGSPAPLQVGVAASLQVQADADVTRVLISGLPAGLLHNETSGTISGTPERPGEFTVSVQFENASGLGPVSTFVLTVQPAEGAPVFTTTALPDAVGGSAYAATLAAAGATSFWADDLPDFLVLDPATGALSGTPEYPGDYAATFHAINEAGWSFPWRTTLHVAPAAGAPVITTTGPVAGTQGAVFELWLAASPVALEFETDALPPGLLLDAATGRIHGTPALPGLFEVEVRARNAAGWSAAAPLVFDLAGPAGSPSITSPAVRVAEAGQPFEWTLETDLPAFAFEIDAIPSGMSFDSALGRLSADALAAGSHTFDVRAINAQGTGGTRRLTLVAGPAVQAWAAGHFGASVVLDPAHEAAVWGDAADPDGDGVPNLLEYLFDTAPASPSAPVLGAPTMDGDVFIWRIQHAVRPDLDVIAEFATDLSFTTLLPGEADALGETDGRVEMEYRATRPPGATRIFARLRAERAAEETE